MRCTRLYTVVIINYPPGFAYRKLVVCRLMAKCNVIRRTHKAQASEAHSKNNDCRVYGYGDSRNKSEHIDGKPKGKTSRMKRRDDVELRERKSIT